ncbi:YopX family protein [Enterococcus gallinarum]|uniref:YopX family protein n=1 Tax=Enterococcus gallinarum TaxID=1353 RepID=UPI00205BF49F|nr:MAG TPA: YopX protein [Caudoviricetes sp.]
MIPKFRAWLKYDKEMKNVLAFDTRGHSFLGIEGPHVTVDGWCDNFEVGNQAEIMQSTEMDDKIGKEIWHKDILDESYTSPLNGEEVIVRYIVEKENGMWKLKDWKGRQQYDRYLFMRNKQCVKIGNVFQNSELLEQANEK